MKVLNVYALSGLFNELYYPQSNDFNTNPIDPKASDPLRSANSLFWAQLFSKDSLLSLVKAMENACVLKSDLSLQERAILANSEAFIELAEKAPIKIIDQGVSQQEFFKWLEILTIACKMFSEYIYYPYEITVQDGFLTPDFSTKKMFEIVLDKTKNPYLQFLEREVFPMIDKMDFDFVWINGQPKASSIAIAVYIRKKKPNCMIALRNHSSEYYSLNKIDTLLKNNQLLFSLIDCIVLDDNVNTYQALEDEVSGISGDISKVNNIIYINRNTNIINLTKLKKTAIEFDECVFTRNTIDEGYFVLSPNKIANLRLNPNTQCFWKKCTFCGINEKYKFILDCEHISMLDKCKKIETLINQGVEYFWFEDEAIAPESLEAFADEVIRMRLKFKWQARSRFHLYFTESLCKKLYEAGLREIRFGLESACNRVLKLMNKFDENIDLAFVERLVGWFVSAGIHVHFPMIVGYPTESVDERNETYAYLEKIKEKYVYFSYNINVLMLDISSLLYHHFPQHDISVINYPCKPSEFLGNMVSFDCADADYSYTEIDEERIAFMVKSLYNWMPLTALTKSHIYYRLSETIRNTLVWSATERTPAKEEKEYTYIINRNVSVWYDNQFYYIYNWDTHNIVRCTQNDYLMLESITTIRREQIDSSKQLQDALELSLIIPLRED